MASWKRREEVECNDQARKTEKSERRGGAAGRGTSIPFQQAKIIDDARTKKEIKRMQGEDSEYIRKNEGSRGEDISAQTKGEA